MRYPARRLRRLALTAACVSALAAGTATGAAAQPAPRAGHPHVIQPAALRVAVIGDSIAWGEGLSDGHKYGELVRQWLARRTGRTVALDIYAHSGARLTAAGTCPSALPGEIPTPTPSAACQLTTAASSGHRFDLVLLSGCINDIQVSTIVAGTTPVAPAVRDTCTAPLRSAIKAAAALPGSPKVVVTGYYQIVSRLTSPTALAAAAPAVLVTSLPGGGTPDAIQALWHQAVQRTGEFSDTFDRVARASVATAPGVATFVQPGFTAADALFAPASKLWTGKNDEMAAERGGECAAIPHIDPVSLASCQVASIGHPNRAGAARYADRIDRAIRSWFPNRR